MNVESYQRVASIMFDDVNVTDGPFPRLRDVLANTVEGYPEPLGDFFVVASDPARTRYFDDDSEAMDATNFAVLKAALDEPAVIAWRPATSDEALQARIGEATERGQAILAGDWETLLAIAPDRGELVATFEGLRDNLREYALLDESAYCERESDAWNGYLHGGLRSDTARELRAREIDEDTIDAVVDAWEIGAPVASKKLTWSNGFTGEHDPPFADVLAATIVEAVARAGFATSTHASAGGPGGARARLAGYAQAGAPASAEPFGARVDTADLDQQRGLE